MDSLYKVLAKKILLHCKHLVLETAKNEKFLFAEDEREMFEVLYPCYKTLAVRKKKSDLASMSAFQL